MNERVVAYMWEGEALYRRAIGIGIGLEDTVGIVVTTIVTTKDTVDTALDVLHIGARTFQLIIEDSSCCNRIMVFSTPDDATEVVTAIDIILDPRETAIIAYMYFGATVDVGIAGTSEGVIDATVAQIEIRVTNDVALVTATIEIFRLSQWQAAFLLRITGIRSLQVDGGAIGSVIGIFALTVLLAYDTFFTTSEYLEGVAVVMVHGGATPYLGVLTFTRTEHGHGYRLHVVALRLFEHSGTTITTDGIWIIRIRLRKDHIALYQILVDVNDHISVDVSAVVAATIDITT